MQTVLALCLLSTAAALNIGVPASARKSAPSPVNGWVPDQTKFAYGLPGTLSPVPEFDPLGFASRATVDEMKRYREAEVTHGRVAMLAVVGFLVQESTFHPFFGLSGVESPAIRQLDYVREASPSFFEYLAVTIGICEVARAQIGWVSPSTTTGETLFKLREDYYPGDVGFDPLGLKPKDTAEFEVMQTKELQHGRLAMLGIAGFVAQELVNGQTIYETLGLQ